jgi:hypothetical protein
MSTAECALIGVGVVGLLLFAMEKTVEYFERRAHRKHKPA